MIKDSTLKLIGQRLSEVVVVDANIVRGELHHKKQPIAVYYLAFGNGCLDEAFELKQFQDKWLAKDYYTHPGYLQWNYYLVFVVSEGALSATGSKRKSSVLESDRNYARKYVVREQELEEFLAGGLVPPGQEAGEVAEDVLARWTRKMDEAGVSEVYGDAPKGQVIARILNGTAQGRPAGSRLDDDSVPVEVPRNIESLTINRFRTHPPAGIPYKFGRANLIFGPNGVGKTSLLEAIELMYCGTNRRDARGISAEVSANFQGLAKPDNFDEQNLQKYKQWNQHWYGRVPFRRERMADYFGRHNFFDTDAGFRITDQQNEEPLRDALAALALGERVNQLEKRLQSFQGDLKQRSQHLAKQVHALQKTISEKEILIKNWSGAPAKSKSLMGVFNAKLRELGIEECAEEGVAATHQVIIGACEALKESVMALPWIERLNLDNVKAELGKATELIRKIREADSTIKENLSHFRNLSDDAIRMEEEIDWLQKIDAYFKLQPGEIDSLTKDIEDAEGKLRRVNQSQTLIEENGLLEIRPEGTSRTLGQAISSCSNDIDSLSSELGKRKKAEAGLKKQVAELDRVLAEIRGLGGQYVKISPNSSTCPLCGYAYKGGELRERVEKHSVQTHVSADLQKLQEGRKEFESKIRIAKATYQRFEQLNEAISIGRGIESAADGQLADLLKEAQGMGARLRDESNTLNSLRRKQEEWGTTGVSQRGLAHARARLKTLLPTVSIDSTGRDGYLKALRTLRRDLETTIRKRHQSQSGTTDITREISRHLAENLGAEGDYEELRKQATERHRILERMLPRLSDISNSFPNVIGGDGRRIYHTLEQVEASISEYLKVRKDEKDRSVLIETAMKEATAAKQSLDELKPQADRCDKAFSAVDGILQNDSKEAAVTAFLRTNIANVERVFRNIHSPREFKSLNPDSLVLTRTTGDEATLANISTGQRAALALAVFISLNFLLKQGPPVILIDDPVAHVDDLNALSFLDFIRNAVVEMDRQVFFSTASTKLAELFRRKFEFLGDEFVEIPLRR